MLQKWGAGGCVVVWRVYAVKLLGGGSRGGMLARWDTEKTSDIKLCKSHTCRC